MMTITDFQIGNGHHMYLQQKQSNYTHTVILTCSIVGFQAEAGGRVRGGREGRRIEREEG